MSQTGPSDPTGPRFRGGIAASGSNRRVAVALVAFVAFMTGLSFAAVPLYRMFCAATGFAGTPQRAQSASEKLFPETVTVRFDANVAPGLPWSFTPVQPEIALHVGENTLAFFRAVNRSKESVTGSAVFNVSPDLMGQYFTKIHCFCFTEQTLKPGEAVEMPVSFFIDPAALNDRDAKTVRDMTLSYTFFKVPKPVPASAAEIAPGRADASLLKTQNPG
jgi:cytochrome c oxidase assembly protein subunit 11